MKHIGWLDEEVRPRPYQEELRVYEDWLRIERELAEDRIDGYCRGASIFLAALDEMSIELNSLQITEIDEIIRRELKRRAWRRRSINHFAQRVRSFVSFAEARGWCRLGLAMAVVAPGFLADEAIPKGIKREDVERLLASVKGTRLVDRRDRAILVLLTSYGLRAGEVAGLQIDDIDWENETLLIRCTKPGRTYLWPLSQDAGTAILDYIQSERPSDRATTGEVSSLRPMPQSNR